MDAMTSEREVFEKWADENGFGLKFRESMFAAWEAGRMSTVNQNQVEHVNAFTPIPEAEEAPTDELWCAYNVFNKRYNGMNTQQALRDSINSVLVNRATIVFKQLSEQFVAEVVKDVDAVGGKCLIWYSTGSLLNTPVGTKLYRRGEVMEVSTVSEVLRDLAKKWRDNAHSDRGYDSNDYFAGLASGKEQCADAIESLFTDMLAPIDAPPKPKAAQEVDILALKQKFLAWNRSHPKNPPPLVIESDPFSNYGWACFLAGTHAIEYPTQDTQP